MSEKDIKPAVPIFSNLHFEKFIIKALNQQVPKSSLTRKRTLYEYLIPRSRYFVTNALQLNITPRPLNLFYIKTKPVLFTANPLPGPVKRLKEFESLPLFCSLRIKKQQKNEVDYLTHLFKESDKTLKQQNKAALNQKANYPKWHKQKEQFNFSIKKF